MKDPVLYLFSELLFLASDKLWEGLTSKSTLTQQKTKTNCTQKTLLDPRIKHHPLFSSTPSCDQFETIHYLFWLFNHFLLHSFSIPFHKCLFHAVTISPGLPLRHRCRKAQACTRSLQLQQEHMRLNPAGRGKYRSKSKLACTAAKGLWVTASTRQWGEPGGVQAHTLHWVFQNPAVAQQTVDPSSSSFFNFILFYRPLASECIRVFWHFSKWLTTWVTPQCLATACISTISVLDTHTHMHEQALSPWWGTFHLCCCSECIVTQNHWRHTTSSKHAHLYLLWV